MRECNFVNDKHRNIPLFLSNDDDEKTKVRNSGDFSSVITEKERKELTPEVTRRHTKFLQLLVDEFGEKPFRRWDLDTGRIGWLINREIKYAGLGKFDPTSANQLLKLDYDKIRISFPEVSLK